MQIVGFISMFQKLFRELFRYNLYTDEKCQEKSDKYNIVYKEKVLSLLIYETLYVE